MNEKDMRHSWAYRAAVATFFFGFVLLCFCVYNGSSLWNIISIFIDQAILIFLFLALSFKDARLLHRQRYEGIFSHEVQPQACIDAMYEGEGKSLDFYSLSYLAICKRLLGEEECAISITQTMLKQNRIKLNAAILHMNIAAYAIDLQQYDVAQKELDQSIAFLNQRKYKWMKAQKESLKKRIDQYQQTLYYLTTGEGKEAYEAMECRRLYEDNTNRCERLIIHYHLALFYLKEQRMDAYQKELAYVKMLGEHTCYPARLQALCNQEEKQDREERL